MWQAITLGVLAGAFAANGVPHFVKGITGSTYPCVFGNNSIPNVVAGWSSFVVGGLFAYWASMEQHGLVSVTAASFGVLAMSLFHAAGLAFGRKS